MQCCASIRHAKCAPRDFVRVCALKRLRGLADEHREAEALLSDYASSNKANKLLAAKKVHSGVTVAGNSAEQSNSSGHSALQLSAESWNLAASNQVDEPEEQFLTEHTDSCESEQMEMYGGALEKLEASSGRSSKVKSCGLSPGKDAGKIDQQIPTPPPLPSPERSSFAKQQRKFYPVLELQYIVRHWSLASPEKPKKASAAKSPEKLLGSVLRLLDRAAVCRHICKRSNGIQENSAAEVSAFPGAVEAPAAAAHSEGGGPANGQGLICSMNGIVTWMTSDQGGCIAKHSRLREVESLCLRWITLYLRHCAATSVEVDVQKLLASSLLPVIEENLDASIEDMEDMDSMFSLSLSLVYTLTFVPDMHILLDSLGPEWSPPQRLSIARICQKAGALADNYLQRLHAPLSPAKSKESSQENASATHDAPLQASVARQEMEKVDLGVMEAVRQVVAAVTTCVPCARTVVDEGENAAEDQSANRLTWSSLPSVVSWAEGTKTLCWHEQYEKRYFEAMDEIKLEAVAGLAETHTYFKAAGTQRPPRQLAKRLMQELVAMQRDLPVSLQEAIIVRFDEERCDFIKLLIIGSLDTPYAAGCFEYHIWSRPVVPR